MKDGGATMDALVDNDVLSLLTCPLVKGRAILVTGKRQQVGGGGGILVSWRIVVLSGKGGVDESFIWSPEP